MGALLYSHEKFSKPCLFDYYMGSEMGLKLINILAGWWFEPLWKIWKSIGMISNPIYGKIKNGNQTTNQLGTITIMNGESRSEPTCHFDRPICHPSSGSVSSATEAEIRPSSESFTMQAPQTTCVLVSNLTEL